VRHNDPADRQHTRPEPTPPVSVKPRAIHRTAGDLVDRAFTRTEPNRLGATGITQHPTRAGKVDGAVVLDTCSRRVVGWSIDSSPGQFVWVGVVERTYVLWVSGWFAALAALALRGGTQASGQVSHPARLLSLRHSRPGRTGVWRLRPGGNRPAH